MKLAFLLLTIFASSVHGQASGKFFFIIGNYKILWNIKIIYKRTKNTF